LKECWLRVCHTNPLLSSLVVSPWRMLSFIKSFCCIVDRITEVCPPFCWGRVTFIDLTLLKLLCLSKINPPNLGAESFFCAAACGLLGFSWDFFHPCSSGLVTYSFLSLFCPYKILVFLE
jgi:hypothetical protein